MSFLQNLTAEELASLAFSLTLILSRRFNDVELSIIGYLLVSMAAVIETMVTIGKVQSAVAEAQAAAGDDKAAEEQRQDLGRLITELGGIVKDLQTQNDSLRQEIRKLQDKLE